MSDQRYKVIATYPGGIIYDNDMALFRAAKHVVGGEGIGGGEADLITGIRSNDWTLDNQRDAELLKSILLTVPIHGLEVQIRCTQN